MFACVVSPDALPQPVPLRVGYLGLGYAPRRTAYRKDELLDPVQLTGVLRWAVEGCQQHLEYGLDAPDEVVAATNEYRSESDTIGRFLDECCVCGEFAQAKARDLYHSFTKWAEGTGENPSTETTFGRRMGERGIVKQHTKTGKVYMNLAYESVMGFEQ